MISADFIIAIGDSLTSLDRWEKSLLADLHFIAKQLKQEDEREFIILFSSEKALCFPRDNNVPQIEGMKKVVFNKETRKVSEIE